MGHKYLNSVSSVSEYTGSQNSYFFLNSYFVVLISRSIYDVHKKIRFFTPPPPCPHASTWAGPPSSPCGRPHAVNMKYTLFSWNG